MKKILLPIVVLSFLIGISVFAQNNELPAPGMTPDSSFYFLKSWKESIQTFFTFGAENKAKQCLHLAEVRLAEYQKMIEKGKTEIAEKTFEKYERQLDRALEKVDEARAKGKDVGNINEEIKGKRIKHMEILGEVSEKMPVETKQEIFEDRAQKWLDFISAVKEKYPGAISNPPEDKANLPAKLILNCPIPKLPEEGTCRGEWSFQSGGNCPYFACSDDGRMPVKEPPVHPTDLPVRPSESSSLSETSTTTRVTTDYGQDNSVVAPERPVTGESGMTEIRYYICPDGTKVESGKCDSEGRCIILMASERQCPQLTTPVTRGSVCTVVGETKYYQCSDGTKIPWCICAPEGGFVGAQNKWQCQYYPVGFTCPKTVSSETPVPTQTATPAPTPTQNPATDYIYGDCVKSGLSKYQCPNGNTINWKCSCLVSEPTDIKYRAGGYTTWSCTAEAEKSCPVSSGAPLAVTLLYLKYYHPSSIEICWSVNKAIVSRYVEYGNTASYGFTKESGSSDEGKFRGCAYFSVGSVDPIELKPFTTYHFRIVSIDIQGNKIVSEDYSFTTSL